MEKEIKKLLKLRDDITKKRNSLYDYRTVTIKGVKNVSVSDLEDIIMRIDNRLGNDIELIKPYGNVREIFHKYGVMAEEWYR